MGRRAKMERLWAWPVRTGQRGGGHSVYLGQCGRCWDRLAASERCANAANCAGLLDQLRTALPAATAALRDSAPPYFGIVT
jgi:hypothetical protein